MSPQLRPSPDSQPPPDSPEGMAGGPGPELPPAELPGWAPLPDYPGPGHPDDVPPETPAEAGAAAAGDGAASPGRTRTRVSTSAVDKVTAGGLAEAMAAIFKGAGTVLNKLTARDDDDRIWLATDDEAAAVGEPLGRILARRVPDLPGEGASDLADGIAAAIPAGIWAIKGLAEWLPRVRKKRRAVPGQVTAPDLSQAAAQ